ncbi:hypothetical protein KKF61_04735, partial [Patescibacteria group bacterium]|nr:hypothetical protein [Patescibacteria group bacterium]
TCLFIGIFLLVYSSPSKFFSSPQKEGISLVWDEQELGAYYNRVAYYYNHQPPYSYNRIEYPALGILYLTIPAFFSDSLEGFKYGLIILNLIAGLLLIAVTYKLLKVLSKSHFWLWLFILPSFLFFLVNRFDVFPALLVQLALLFLFRKRFTLSFVILGLALLTKGYAIIFFPIFIVYWLNKTGRREMPLIKNKYLWIFVGPAIVITAIICFVAGFENGLFPYIFQSTRQFAQGAVYVIYFEALQKSLPAIAYTAIIKIVSYGLVFLQFLLPLLIYAGYSFFKKFIKTPQDVIRWMLLAAMIYILFSPYYSPQWIIWILPLMVLALGGGKKMVLLVVIYDILNYLQFPVIYNFAGPYSLSLDILVLARTILFVIIIWLLVNRIKDSNKNVVII